MSNEGDKSAVLSSLRGASQGARHKRAQRVPDVSFDDTQPADIVCANQVVRQVGRQASRQAGRQVGDRSGDPSGPHSSGAVAKTRTQAPSGRHLLPPVPLQPGVLVGQYQLIRQIGRGGMGEVFLARDTRLGRRVAIKFLSHDDPARAERFLAEARVTARCKHENIVVIHDVGKSGGRTYMVLEYLEGVTLREWLYDRWQVDADRQEYSGSRSTDDAVARVPDEASVSATLAVEFMVPVVRALVRAHALGLVHRDLKPENIMLADDGSIKVLDFGIAKVLDTASVIRSMDADTVEITGPIARMPSRQITDADSDDLDDSSAGHSSGHSSGPLNGPATGPLSGKIVEYIPAHTTDKVVMNHDMGALGLDDGAFFTDREFLTREGALVGSRPYMSPEQWGVGKVDARTDIWAVGILFWELCTGHHPLAPLTHERVLSISDLDLTMPDLRDERPELGQLAAVVSRCLRKRAEERIPSAQALLDQLEPLLPGRGRRAPTVTGDWDNPYVGLAAFQHTDAARFFGRGRDIASMMAQLRNHRLITVAGASGAGKSSFIRAGVIPALERSGQTWESFVVRPGRQPLATLADVLSQVVRAMSDAEEGAPEAEAQHAHIDTLRTQPGYLGTVLRARCHSRNRRILLFVDQFEELYTLGADRDTREVFVRCLEGVADDASSPLRVILSVRSDFLDRVAEDRAFTSEFTRAMLLLSPLSRKQLRRALTEPLAAAGYRFQSQALVESMLDTLQSTRSPLPLLQFTGARLWDMRDRDGNRITQASYDSLGGIEGALATHADAVLAGLSRDEQRLARAVFTNLVSDERTRAIVSLDELRAGGKSDEAVDSVVRHLAEARLVLMETDSEGGATVELTHESLIARWPKLVQWLDEDLEAAHFRSRLRAAARQWDQQQRTEDLLWRGRAASEARHWQSRDDVDLSELSARDRAFLHAVVELDARARQRRRRLSIAGFVLISAVAVAFSLLAVRAERKADEAARLAIRADREARQAQASTARAQVSAAAARNASRMASALQHRSDPTLALALVRELERSGPLPPRWRELARWATHQDIARSVFSHPAGVTSVAVSPDGSRVATACEDNMARVYSAVDASAHNHPPVLLRGHHALVASVAFSPDGRRVVTASWDKTARVFQADGSGPSIVLSGHDAGLTSAAFGPDGTRVVTASWDKSTRIFATDGSGQLGALVGHEDVVTSARFRADGARVVTASLDGTARIWRTDGSDFPGSQAGDRPDDRPDDRPVVLRGHLEGVNAAVFSPDGTRVVTVSADKTGRIWNADGTGEPVVLSGHEARVLDVAFSPDGTRVATVAEDLTTRIWTLAGTDHGADAVSVFAISGHRDQVTSVTFTPDGQRLVTGSRDKTARIWTAHKSYQKSSTWPMLLLGHAEKLASASFSPDGTRVATASYDQTARVFRADGTSKPVILGGHDDIVYSVEFSPDGQRVLTGSFDKTARIWNADGTGEPIVLGGPSGHQHWVVSASFSPDGTRVVTASQDRTARVWNADGSGVPVVLVGHEDAVYSAAFSVDGKRIVTASQDRSARIWNADGSGRPMILTGHQDGVNAASFSPDGTRVVTSSYDQTARVWSVNGRHSPIVLAGHTAGVFTGTHTGHGAFSPDGTRIVTISDDKSLRVWRVDAAEHEPGGGSGPPAVLRIPDVDAYTAAFSPDGTRIVTASHSERDPITGEVRHGAAVWPSFKRFASLDDPALWTPTSYCPPVSTRVELLGVGEDLADEQRRRCHKRVASP